MQSPAKRSEESSLFRAFVRSLIATLVFVALFLVSAGRPNVWQAWVYVGISVALNLAQRIVLRSNPELVRERAKPGAGAQSWDKALLGLGLLLTLGKLVTAGLQYRYSQATSLGLPWFVVGVALNFLGGILFLWALKENRFFSAVVRIQSDKGHAVCTTGPYRLVRHPGNLGMIIGTLGFPLLFQSTWSFVPSILSVLVLVVRTHLEDGVLTGELEGYRAYQQQTRFRLVPGVW